MGLYGKEKDEEKKQRKKKIRILLLVMAIVLLLFPVSIKFMDDALLNNAQRMGGEIARRFAANEETYLNQYEMIIQTLEYQIASAPEDVDLAGILKTIRSMRRILWG